MLRNMNRYLLLTFVAAGCAGRVTPPLPPNDSLENALRDVMVEAVDELRLLAKNNSARTSEGLTAEQQAQRFFQATYIPPGFEAVADFSFVGEAEVAARALAMLAGYRFEVRQESQPGAPIFVQLNGRGRTLHGFFRDLMAQIGQAAEINVYPGAKLMEFTAVRPSMGGGG